MRFVDEYSDPALAKRLAKEIVAGPGDIIVVPPDTPHKFLSRGETHRQISIHPVPRMQTEWLE